jgi:nucleoid DNA-binding protein
MTKRTNNNLQTGQTIQWPKGCIVCPVCKLLFVLLAGVLSVLFVDCCLSFRSLYCLSCLLIVVCPFCHCIVYPVCRLLFVLRTNNNLQTGQTIQWPKRQTTIYKQDRQYNDQRTNNNLQTEQTIQWPKGKTIIYKQDRQYNDRIVCPVCRLLFVLLRSVLSVLLFVDYCLSFWSLYCLSCL